jgi:biotin-dependent carboxylase-like uncharacterized protein
MIEIIAPGPYAALQDGGRAGLRHLGISASGAADRASHRLANALVGNRSECATIEILAGGLAVRLTAAATVAITGARCPVPERPDLDWAAPVSLPAGTVLRLATPTLGLRSYLAVRGGFDVPDVLGSRSTDSLSGLGPQPLSAGVGLPIGRAIQGDPIDAPAPRSALASAAPVGAAPAAVVIGVRPGPRVDWLAEDQWHRLSTTTWQVDPSSNRIGIRLAGARLDRRSGELASEPTLTGAVQLPPDGRPIILGPDGPVTGGYPVVAVVAGRELDRLAQLRPGDAVRLSVER